MIVNLPEGVEGLVSFWRGHSETCQCWILEFGFVLQILIFSVALHKYYFELCSLELFLQIFIFSFALHKYYFKLWSLELFRKSLYYRLLCQLLFLWSL